MSGCDEIMVVTMKRIKYEKVESYELLSKLSLGSC